MLEHIQLIETAVKARNRARAPYSKFDVGAALLTSTGETIIGANIESASYGLSCCAERVAIFKALTEGHNEFAVLAIASAGGAAPCGACRQIIAEYAPKADLLLIDTNSPNSTQKTSIENLLPSPFTDDNLPSN